MDNNTRSYNRIADLWDGIRKAKPVDPCVVSFADRLPANANILDIGCGSGYPIDYYLAGRGFCVTGIDPSGKMIEKAFSLKLERACFYRVDLFGFETDEVFDAVVAFDSIFHIPFEEQKKIYPKISALLKKNGLFLFTHGAKSENAFGTMFGEPFSYGALDIKTLKNELFNCGFEIVEFFEDYNDDVTGTRDLLALVRKK